MARPLSLPAERVRLGQDLPDVCVRHGITGGPIRRQRVTFTTRTPTWVYPIYVVAIVIGIIVAFVLRESVTCTSWPVCQACLRYRMRCQLAMAGCLLAWVPLTWITATTVHATTLALLTFFLMPVAALCFAIAGSWSSTLKGHLSGDQNVVRFDGAHRAFIHEVAEPSPPAAAVVEPAVEQSMPATESYTFFGN